MLIVLLRPDWFYDVFSSDRRFLTRKTDFCVFIFLPMKLFPLH